MEVHEKKIYIGCCKYICAYWMTHKSGIRRSGQAHNGARSGRVQDRATGLLVTRPLLCMAPGPSGPAILHMAIVLLFFFFFFFIRRGGTRIVFIKDTHESGGIVHRVIFLGISVDGRWPGYPARRILSYAHAPRLDRDGRTRPTVLLLRQS